MFSGIIASSDGRSLLNTKKDAPGDPSMLTDAEGSAKWRQRNVPADDMALIGCIQEDTTHTTYFTRPPLQDLTLFFEDERVEKEYRRVAWKGLRAPLPGPVKDADHVSSAKTVSQVHFDAYFDMFLVFLFFFVVSVDSFWSSNVSMIWVVYFIIASAILLAAIFVLYKNLSHSKGQGDGASGEKAVNGLSLNAAGNLTLMTHNRKQKTLVNKVCMEKCQLSL